MNQQLQIFLYLLARDHMPAGIVEELVRRSEKNKEDDIIFTNKDLASMASKWAERLYVK